jgi:hypothetical protein
MNQKYFTLIQAIKSQLLSERKKKRHLFSPFYKNAIDTFIASIPRRSREETRYSIPSFHPSTASENTPHAYAHPAQPSLPNHVLPSLDDPKRKEADLSARPQSIELLPDQIKLSPPSLSNSVREWLEKSAPHLKLKEHIPNDEVALQYKHAWRYRSPSLQILIIDMELYPTDREVLLKISRALTAAKKNNQVVRCSPQERWNSWDLFLSLPSLTCVIGPPLDQWRAPLLQSQIRLNPSTNQATIGKIKVLFLPPLAKLSSDPQYKLQVWQWLKTNLHV